MIAQLGDVIIHQNGREIFNNKIVAIGTVGSLILKGYLSGKARDGYTFVKEFKFQESDFQTEDEYLECNNKVKKLIEEAKLKNIW
jgi:hypothetical protein